MPDLPETLLTGREREYVGWFLKAKALSPGTFDAAESARRNREALRRQRLTVPVLGISGSHGSIPDMAASLGPWAGRTTGIVVPDAGHFIPDEQPEAVAAALTDFITEDA